MTPKTNACPCGSNQTYAACCEPFHTKKSFPETAEKLMRSRYSAYVVGNISYIAETNDPTSKDAFDEEAAEAWSKESEWLGLEIVATRDGQAGDTTGEVEFKAKFKSKAKGSDEAEQVHHEISLFHKKGTPARWQYIDGKTVRDPLTRSEPKIGRNDPCSCGSGKKYKKCCAA
jgi:SEC-C motif-containing protein